MKKHSSRIPQRTVGLDVGDRKSWYCILEREGDVVGRGSVTTSRKAMGRFFAGLEASRVALEVGAQSAWIAREAAAAGHEVLVANPRRVRLITESRKKSDEQDAEQLARLARVDPKLLHPIQHRGVHVQVDLARLRSRDLLVRSRAGMIAHVRGMVKTLGERLPACSAECFARRAADAIPAELQEGLGSVIESIAELTAKIRTMDRQIAALCEQRYKETGILRQISGVGPITALAFVLTLEDPGRFAKSRRVGPYLGLVPRRDQSGDWDPQLRITKQGDALLRRLLVQSAQYILGPFGPDTDLRRFGEALAQRGGKNAKKRAIVAVARKLSVLLHHLWVTGEVYEPLYNAQRSGRVVAA